MADLHTRTLAAIAYGQLESAPYADGQSDIESIEEFARRVAIIEQEEAVRIEREWLVNRCGQLSAFHRAGEDEDREEIAYALDLLGKEIAGRGKP